MLVVDSKSERQQIQARIEANKTANAEAVAAMEKLVMRPEVKELLVKIKELRVVYAETYTKAADLIEEGKRDLARDVILKQTVPALNALQEKFSKLEEIEKEVVNEKADQSLDAVRSSIMMILALGGALFSQELHAHP